MNTPRLTFWLVVANAFAAGFCAATLTVLLITT